MFARPARGLLLAATVLSAAVLPSSLAAQYFGQNKVQYEAFDF